MGEIDFKAEARSITAACTCGFVCGFAWNGTHLADCETAKAESALRRIAARVWREAAHVVAEEGVIPTVSGVDNVIDALATRLRKCAAEVERDG